VNPRSSSSGNFFTTTLLYGYYSNFSVGAIGSGPVAWPSSALVVGIVVEILWFVVRFVESAPSTNASSIPAAVRTTMRLIAAPELGCLAAVNRS